jgi:carbon monoxide dehydrogenase subunit G
MATIATSIVINRPIEDVFKFITTLENQKSIQPGITDVILSGPLAVGARYTLKGQVMGRNFSTDNEIVALEPNKTFGIKTMAPAPASPVTTTYTLEPSGSGTKLTASMDTVIFPGTEGMVKPALIKALDGANATVKKVLEG